MYKLLIVEDEYEIRYGLCNYIPWNELGFELVGQVENGLAAWEFINRTPVDVILCDIKMPVLSGLELAEKLSGMESKPEIVFLSGHKDFEYVRKALIYNARDYIVKPTKYNELKEVFTKLRAELDHSNANIPPPAQNTPQSSLTSGETDKIILAVKLYIEENYKTASLEEAARRVHLSPYYLSKFFKEKTGQNFSDQVISVKMRKAAELLNDLRYKTYEVGDLVGYTDAKNFTRTFKKFYGISPKEFRKG